MRKILQTLALLLACCQLALAEPERVALVIGNADYHKGRLSNPIADARAMKQALKEAGFDVTLVENANKKEMNKAISDFGRRLNENTISLFYFSGHGVQYEDNNYLIPIGGENINNWEEIKESSVAAKYPVNLMVKSKSAANIVILDACRNDPFPDSAYNPDRDIKVEGLAEMSVKGAVIAYSTAAGAKALDGPPGDNSPYTKTLIKWIRSDQPIATALANVAAEVYQETNGKQFPWFHYGMIGNFSFMPQAAGSSNTAATVRQDEDAWVERLGAWADEFQIQEKDLPRDKAALLALQKLDLSRYHSPLPKITRLPPEIGQLQQLRELYLNGNQLTALPAAIGQLQQLRELWLGDNQLTTLPAAIGQLQQLQILSLGDNQLTTLPAELFQLQQLQVLGLNDNQLTALPAELFQLQQLQVLSLVGNQLTALPAELFQLQQLQQLYLDDNQLTALPAAIGQLQQLRELYLNGNQLTALPAAIGQLQQLQRLTLRKNQLTTLPDEITRLRQLEALYIKNNPKLQLTPAQEQFLQGVKEVDR